MEMLHLMEGVVPQFHVANRHTEYMIPPELFETTIKAFGHCEDAGKHCFCHITRMLLLETDMVSIFWIERLFEFVAKGQTDACEAAYIMLKCFKADGNDFWFK